MSRKVTCFLGVEGSGKSYNSNKLVKDLNYVKMSFADALREMAFKVIGMDFNEGMEHYAELKKTELVNGQNFRNILENLGSAVREHSEDFWVDAVINKIDNTDKNICIDDMRYPNEYIKVYNYCKKNNIEFRAYFCCYKSDVFRDDNPHESAQLANHLYNLGYKDLEEIDMEDVLTLKHNYAIMDLKTKVKEAMQKVKDHARKN